jgi:O-antigen/teichoic acid export membrane protein
MRLGLELKRLARHSAIYGIGGLVSRILAVLLLPLYTRFLTRADYGRVETITAATAVLVIVLRLGVSSAFFRFYFDYKDARDRLRVVRTSFWFTMTMATAGLVLGLVFAPQISDLLHLGGHPDLVRAGAVALWAQMNYEQLTALFRVEERSVAYALASLANVLITIGMTVLLVAILHKGSLGLIVGNFIGTLVVWAVLLAYRHEQLGLELDRPLLRRMQVFGLPLVPSALALWAINFIDRLFVAAYKGQGEVGVYSVAIRVSAAVTFLMIAFRTAWPAFAYSIEDDREARRTYAYVLTYLLLVASWLALALGALAPWLVQLLTTPRFQRAEEAVALLAFAGVAYAGYTVLAIGSGRARKTQLNWVVTGVGAGVNVGLNFWLVPAYGMVGAAVSTLIAYVTLFGGMLMYAQSVYAVPYQWRRVATAVAAAVGLTLLARWPDLGLGVSIALVAVYPLVLAVLGFYLPAERKRFLRVMPRARPADGG